MGSVNGSRQLGGSIATLQRAKRELGQVASRQFSSGPVPEIVIVSIVSIFLLRSSG